MRSRASLRSVGRWFGKLCWVERPSQDERERDEPNAGDVRPVIEARQPGARRHRNPELLPEPFAAELQLFDRGREHVLHDHQSRVRRHHEPLGRNQAVRDFAGVLVQQRDGRNELTNQAERGVDVELEVPLVGHAQNVREPRAFDVIRHDRQPGAGHLHAVDAPHARIVGVPEVGQPRRALAQRELERRHRGQCRSDAENLQQFARRAIGGDNALAKAIAEKRSFGPFVWERYGCHGGPGLRGATIGPDRTRFLGSTRKSLNSQRSGAVSVCMREHTDLRGCRVTLGFVTGNPPRTAHMLTLASL